LPDLLLKSLVDVMVLQLVTAEVVHQVVEADLEPLLE